MNNLLRRVEKLEQESSGIGAMIWRDLHETKEQAMERYRCTHPGVLERAESVMVLSWLRPDEGAGA